MIAVDCLKDEDMIGVEDTRSLNGAPFS